MAFFKPKPNLPVDEKARVEFHLQQIVDSIGLERFLLPVLDSDFLLNNSSLATNQETINFVGSHLNHDVSGIRIAVNLQEPEKCGGGG